MEKQNKDAKVEKSQDEIWDEQLDDPENAVFFEKLDKEIADALLSGDFEEDGDVSDSDEIKK